MGRGLWLCAAVCVVAISGCRTTREDVPLAPDSPSRGQEPIQTVPDSPPGPAEPMADQTDGGSPTEQ